VRGCDCEQALGLGFGVGKRNLCRLFAIRRSHGCERAAMEGHVYNRIDPSARSDGGLVETGA
jgi:hypothetical protein